MKDINKHDLPESHQGKKLHRLSQHAEQFRDALGLG